MIVVAATSRTRLTLRTSSCSGLTTDWPPELVGRRSGSEAGMKMMSPRLKGGGSVHVKRSLQHWTLQCSCVAA